MADFYYDDGDDAVWRTLAFKVCGALASTLLAVVGCWAARALHQVRSEGNSARDVLLMVGNTIAAGILLAASLVHMLPDAVKGLAAVSDFPLPSAIAGAAFVFLTVLGEVVTGLMPTRDDPHVETACVTYRASFAVLPHLGLLAPGASCEDPAASCTSHGGEPAAVGHGCAHDEHGHGGHGGHGGADAGGSCGSDHGGGDGHGHVASRVQSHGHGHGHGPVARAAPRSSSCPACGSTSSQKQRLSGPGCTSHAARCRIHRHTDAPCNTASTASAAPKKGALLVEAIRALEEGLEAHGAEALTEPLLHASVAPMHGHGHGHDLRKIGLCHVRSEGGGAIAEVKSLLLFFALCFHSVMEGLGMGSAQNNGLLVGVMVAVLAHKGLAAFALGCSLTQTDLPPWKFWAFVLVFASGTPIGIALGMLSANIGDSASQSVTSAVCIALSSGTFLQVAAMELLPRALAEEGHKLKGCVGLTVGFLAMSTLAIWC
mmetsp:Transcript_44876/g.143091  ORF Transcript_44876/g.143091 Transcript_44876/m.143091 type:complete len:487 (+) Transcript_44876:93-1553(+)